MQDKKVYSVVVEVNVEANSLDDANERIASHLRLLKWPSNVTQAEVMSDFETDNNNKRVFRVHPVDVDAEYDSKAYIKHLKKDVEQYEEFDTLTRYYSVKDY